MTDDFLARTHTGELRIGVAPYQQVRRHFAHKEATAGIDRELELTGGVYRTPSRPAHSAPSVGVHGWSFWYLLTGGVPAALCTRVRTRLV
jgi:hypothetical protein